MSTPFFFGMLRVGQAFTEIAPLLLFWRVRWLGEFCGTIELLDLAPEPIVVTAGGQMTKWSRRAGTIGNCLEPADASQRSACRAHEAVAPRSGGAGL